MSNEQRCDLYRGSVDPTAFSVASGPTRSWHGSVNGHAQAVVIVGMRGGLRAEQRQGFAGMAEPVTSQAGGW